MVKVFVGNGAGSAAQQVPVVKINDVEMSLDQAELALLAMPMSARCSAITMHDAQKLQKHKGLILTDGVASTISFIGTVAEWQGQTKNVSPSWCAATSRYAYVH